VRGAAEESEDARAAQANGGLAEHHPTMIRPDHKIRAINSYQLLRGKAHALLEEIFPNKVERYAWLKRYAPKMHMSKCTKKELEYVIDLLEGKVL